MPNLDNLSEFHLDIALNAIRERNWGLTLERLFGLIIFIVLKLAKVNRLEITRILFKLQTITYITAEKYCSKLINGEEESLFSDNRGKYHRYSIFEDEPDLKEQHYNFTVDKISQ